MCGGGRELTLKGAHTALIGALASSCRHGHHIPFDIEQKVTQIDANIDLIGRVC